MRRRKRTRAGLRHGAALLLPLSLGVLAHAQTPPPANPSRPAGAERYLTKGAPVRIRSEKMAVFNKENRAVFSGSVVARQGDVTIRCREAVARYKAGGGLAGLVATGAVRVRKSERRATGERLTYDHETRVMELTGRPRLFERDSFVEGSRIVFHLDDDRIDVERARGRLKVEEGK